MAARCGEPHPEASTRTCRNPEGAGHAEHWDATGVWPNEQVHQRLSLLASNGAGRRGKAQRRRDVVEVAATVLSSRRGADGAIPADAVARWSKDAWMVLAEDTFRRFLLTRTEPFTTAEDVWPLLPKPEEMRAMSLVTQRMLKAKAMHEVGAVRLRGTYTTADGFEFRENKLVPVYESLCAREGSA